MSTTVSAERTWCVVVPHQPRGARVARQRLSAALAGLVSQERLSDGMSIAAELVLSVRTVERHLQNAYAKLGLQGRTARTAAVARLLARA